MDNSSNAITVLGLHPFSSQPDQLHSAVMKIENFLVLWKAILILFVQTHFALLSWNKNVSLQMKI